MRTAYINGRWPLKLPKHRARFHEEHPWWEAARLADMFWQLDGALGKQRSWRSYLPQTLLDVGSEEGDLTALYASWGFSVAFIDPSKAWISQTISTLRENGLDVGPSFIGLADDHLEVSNRIVTEARFVTMDEQVPRITLDHFCGFNGFKPDAVSMDVEGAELRVLEGAEDLLSEDVVWWISIHGDVDPHAETPSEVHRFMRNHGYDDQFLAYDHEWHYRFWRPF